MNRITGALVLLGVSLCFIGAAGHADMTSRLGLGFAAAHEAFGPIYGLHAEYGDFLFEGTIPTVPPGLKTACEEFLHQLASMHLLFVTQTLSDIASPPSWVHLRVRADAFCLRHGSMLQSISGEAVLGEGQLQTASESGLFPAVFELNEFLELAFTETFEGLPNDESRWRFSVSFSAGALVLRREIQRIDEDLATIFYGGEGRTELPFAIAASIEEAMKRLVSLSGRDLEGKETNEAGDLAKRILDAFVALPET